MDALNEGLRALRLDAERAAASYRDMQLDVDALTHLAEQYSELRFPRSVYDTPVQEALRECYRMVFLTGARASQPLHSSCTHERSTGEKYHE